MLRALGIVFLIFILLGFLDSGGFGLCVGLLGGLVGVVGAIFGAVFGVVAGLFGALIGIFGGLFALALPAVAAVLIIAGICYLVTGL